MPEKTESSKERKNNIIASQKTSEADFEKRVLKLAEEGLTAEKIGESLRHEGIHPSEYDKKISRVLKEKDTYKSHDLKNIEEKLRRIELHLEKNKQDKKALREKTRIFAQLRKLKKYHGVPVK